MLSGILVAAGALVSLAQPAASAPPREPTGQWVVNFNDAECLAHRHYGTATDPLTLVLKQPPLGSVIQVAVLTGRGVGDPVQRDAAVTFDGGPAARMTGLQFSARETDRRTFLVNLPEQVFARATSAKTMRVQVGRLDETFVLSQVKDLTDVMRTCVEDLRRVWSVTSADDESDRPLADPRARGLLGIFSHRDYPAAAIRNEQMGTTRVVLLVDETGSVADCSVIETSGVAVLDSQTCAVIRERAKFKPFRTPDDKPTKAAFIQRITWRIE